MHHCSPTHSARVVYLVCARVRASVSRSDSSLLTPLVWSKVFQIGVIH